MNARVLALSPSKAQQHECARAPFSSRKTQGSLKEGGWRCGKKDVLRKGGACPGGAGAAPEEHRGPQLSPAEQGNS